MLEYTYDLADLEFDSIGGDLPSASFTHSPGLGLYTFTNIALAAVNVNHLILRLFQKQVVTEVERLIVLLLEKIWAEHLIMLWILLLQITLRTLPRSKYQKKKIFLVLYPKGCHFPSLTIREQQLPLA
jgi:hypothetical protein